MVKITDVAARVGVAKSTVSNVLTGKKYVSEELKQKVLQACKELDFQPNFYASGLSSKKTNIIALLLEATEGISSYPFYMDLILSCLKQAAAKEHSLLLYYDSDKEKLLQTLRQGRAPIDGAILLAPSVNDERLAEMENTRTACVVIGRPSEEKICYIDVDNKALVAQVVEKLSADYGKNIYLFNSQSELTISQDRNLSFIKSCEKLGVDGKERIFESSVCSDEDGYNFAKGRVVKDAVFITANEAMAKGVYRAVQEAGLKVGQDVAVFALGRSVEHGSFSPKLSYALQNYDELGKMAVDALLDEISGNKPNSVLVESKLVFRDSTNRNLTVST